MPLDSGGIRAPARKGWGSFSINNHMNIEQEMQNYVGAIIKYSNKMYLESPVCDKDDLVQAGYIGMLNGLKSFSKDKAKKTNTKKTTYVIQCIKNAILQEANKFYGTLTIPHNKRLKLNSFSKMISSGKSKEEIMEKMELSEKEFDELSGLRVLRNNTSLSSLQEEENEPVEKKNQIDITTLIDQQLFNLSKEDMNIIVCKYSGMTYNDIADMYNVSRETMRKRVEKIISKIRKKMDNNE